MKWRGGGGREEKEEEGGEERRRKKRKKKEVHVGRRETKKMCIGRRKCPLGWGRKKKLKMSTCRTYKKLFKISK